jgi:transposase
MLRPSFVPPPAIRALRDLTRYRVDLLAVRTAEKQRVDKLLEDALIKLSVVVSDPFGASGRAIMAALIAGERDPDDAGRSGSRPAAGHDRPADRGADRPVHRAPRLLLTQMLARVDGITVDIATVQARIDAQMGELAPAVARLDAIPGVGPVAAQMILAEIGTDMTRFPTPAHLTSWARFAPGVSESAGRPTGNAGTGTGNRYLARIVGEAAVSAARTDTFLGERYRRIARRRGKKRAIVAVGRSILVVIWALLSTSRRSSSTSARTSMRPAPTPSAKSASTCANCKRSATASPSTPPPDPGPGNFRISRFQGRPGSVFSRRPWRRRPCRWRGG